MADDISEQVAQGIVKGAGRIGMSILIVLLGLGVAAALFVFGYGLSDAMRNAPARPAETYFRWSDGTLHHERQPPNRIWTDAAGVKHEVDAVTGKLAGPLVPFEGDPPRRPARK